MCHQEATLCENMRLERVIRCEFTELIIDMSCPGSRTNIILP